MHTDTDTPGFLMSASMPAMQWLREYPRYHDLMESTGSVEYWNTFGDPCGCHKMEHPDGFQLESLETTE